MFRFFLIPGVVALAVFLSLWALVPDLSSYSSAMYLTSLQRSEGASWKIQSGHSDLEEGYIAMRNRQRQLHELLEGDPEFIEALEALDRLALSEEGPTLEGAELLEESSDRLLSALSAKILASQKNYHNLLLVGFAAFFLSLVVAYLAVLRPHEGKEKRKRETQLALGKVLEVRQARQRELLGFLLTEPPKQGSEEYANQIHSLYEWLRLADEATMISLPVRQLTAELRRGLEKLQSDAGLRVKWQLASSEEATVAASEKLVRFFFQLMIIRLRSLNLDGITLESSLVQGDEGNREYELRMLLDGDRSVLEQALQNPADPSAKFQMGLLKTIALELEGKAWSELSSSGVALILRLPIDEEGASNQADLHETPQEAKSTPLRVFVVDESLERLRSTIRALTEAGITAVPFSRMEMLDAGAEHLNKFDAGVVCFGTRPAAVLELFQGIRAQLDEQALPLVALRDGASPEELQRLKWSAVVQESGLQEGLALTVREVVGLPPVRRDAKAAYHASA